MGVDINKVLKDHSEWLDGSGGRRADLKGADLWRADLREADLRGAILCDCNFHETTIDFKGTTVKIKFETIED